MPLKSGFARRLSSQSGSILTAALGVALLVGTLSYTTYSLLSGPVRSAAIVTLKTKAQNELILGAKLLMRSATDSEPDGAVEPPPADMSAPVLAIVGSTNGGGIPATVGAEKVDPWRTLYAYCAWNHGSTNTGVAGLLDGEATSPAYNSLIAVAIISAGPDRVFQTTCSPLGVMATSGDDIVVRYTYEQASTVELWKESGGGAGLETSNAMQNVGIGKPADPLIKLDVFGDSKFDGGTLTAGTVDINGGTIDSVAIAGSTINSSAIGGTTPSSGAFTTLNASAGTTTVGLTGTGVTTLSGTGTINGISIGATTPSTGHFTNLSWTGSMTPPNTNVVANLNADLLDGNDGSFYQDASNLNTGTLDVARTPAYQGDVSKVAGDDYTFVEALQGYTIDLSNAPAANTVLGWDSSNNTWKAMTVETGAGGPGAVGVSGVNYLATEAAINSTNCSDGQIPKLVAGAWACTADISGSLTLPINADNATSPSGQIISGTVSAVVESYLTFKSSSVFLGPRAGKVSVSNGNVMVGDDAGKNATTGGQSVYVGQYAGGGNPIGGGSWFYLSPPGTSGAQNTAIGAGAGASITTAKYNTLIGAYSGGKLTTTGSVSADGTADMTYVMQANTFVGTNSGLDITTGSNNTLIGTEAGARLETTSAHNTHLGSNAGRGPYGPPGVVRTGNTIIGSFAGYETKVADNNVFLGRDAGRASFTPSNSIYIGNQAGRNYSAGLYNIFIGLSTGYGDSNSTGSSNVFVGGQAGEKTRTSSGGVYIGHQAGRYVRPNLDGNIYANTFIGYQAGQGVDTVTNIINSTYVGSGAGSAVTTGSYGTFIGSYAGGTNTTGEYNTFVGGYAGNLNTIAGKNVYVGSNAGRYIRNTVAADGLNTMLGFHAGIGVNGSSTGTGNTYIGGQAGSGTTTGANNILVGVSAGSNLTVGSGNLIIGNSASAPANNTNNYLLVRGNGGDVLRGTMNSGNLSAQGAALDFHSDSRLKNDIEAVENPVDSLVKIRGVTFKWNGLTNKDTESTQYGVVAQEVEKVFPHLVTLGPVSANGKRYLEVAYNGFIPILIEAVKQQQHEIEERDAKIAKMQSDIDDLKQAVKALQAAR
jgi:hypothetical protein